MTIKNWTSFGLIAALAMCPASAMAGTKAAAAIPDSGKNRPLGESGHDHAVPPAGLLNGYNHASEHGREGIERGAFEHRFKSKGC